MTGLQLLSKHPERSHLAKRQIGDPMQIISQTMKNCKMQVKGLISPTVLQPTTAKLALQLGYHLYDCLSDGAGECSRERQWRVDIAGDIYAAVVAHHESSYRH